MQTKDLADILRQRDDEKYKHIIIRAANNGYHDHKFEKIPGHPEYGDCLCPKMQLIDDLSPYPELLDIIRQVVNGDFDEPADEQDQQEMRGWLINDGAPDEMFKQMGFAVPTEAERLLKKPINN